MRISRLVTAVLSLAAAGALTACGEASLVNSVVPTNIVELQAKEPGKSLKEYGYTPVAYLFNHDDDSKIIGELYIDCGETDLTVCSNDMHNRGTHERPNVYVVDSKVVVLEGPHDSDSDNRSYFSTVPESHREFGGLTGDEQRKLLSIMPTIAKVIGHPSGDETSSVQTDIGLVDAWVSREEPRLVP